VRSAGVSELDDPDFKITSKNLDQVMPDWLLIEGGDDVKEWVRDLLLLQEKHGWDSPQVKHYMEQTMVGLDTDCPSVDDLKGMFGDG